MAQCWIRKQKLKMQRPKLQKRQQERKASKSKRNYDELNKMREYDQFTDQNYKQTERRNAPPLKQYSAKYLNSCSTLSIAR